MAQPLNDPANRIPFIKYVLSTALDQAKQPEPYCTGAILGLHDAVELFVQLIADHVGASVPNRADFLHYWPAVKAGLGADLPQQQAMKRLNQARVGLKHHGIRPSRDDLEELASKTVLFFDEASRLVFGAGLETLSSVSLVPYEPTASRLRRAEVLAADRDYDAASRMCALAFDEAVSLFRSTHDEPWARRSPFPRLKDVAHFNAVSLGYEWSQKNREHSKHLEKISRAFAEIEPVLLTLALGIEYRDVARFEKVTPDVNGMGDGSRTIGTPRTAPTERDIRFAVSFATQVALRLQELDPNPPAVGADHPFQTSETFAVMLPAQGSAPERAIGGALTEIGGGWEAWIYHGDRLTRVWRGENQNAAVGYLTKYRLARIQDGGKDRCDTVN